LQYTLFSMTECWYCNVVAGNTGSGTNVVEVDWIIFCCWTTVSEDNVWRTWKQSYKLSIDIQSQLIPFWNYKIRYQINIPTWCFLDGIHIISPFWYAGVYDFSQFIRSATGHSKFVWINLEWSSLNNIRK
jgi:hypothetical protein